MAEPDTKQPQTKNVGICGLFDDVNDLVAAAKKVRDAGYKKWDCHTPYPVHGLDAAMGLRDTPVPYITLTAGFTGLASAIVLTGGLSAWHYPIMVGGKAFFSWQAFTPLYFELFVLFAAIATFGSVVALCKLGNWHSPLHDSGIMPEVTCDRFAIVINAADGRYSEADARALLDEAGCKDIRPLVEFEEEDDALI